MSVEIFSHTKILIYSYVFYINNLLHSFQIRIATNCEIIITRNEKDFKRTLIPILNPESYLQTLKK